MFTGIRMDELDGDGINRIENVFMLSMAAHSAFGKLKLWLEAVEVRHFYNECHTPA